MLKIIKVHRTKIGNIKMKLPRRTSSFIYVDFTNKILSFYFRTEYEDSCKTVYDQQCSTKYDNKCETKYEVSEDT